jgi:hypothetical protein
MHEACCLQPSQAMGQYFGRDACNEAPDFAEPRWLLPTQALGPADSAAGEANIYPQEVTRVLLNLISNGFYASAKRGRFRRKKRIEHF